MSKRKSRRTATGKAPRRKVVRRSPAPSLDRLLAAVRTDPDNVEARLRLAEHYLGGGSEDKVLDPLNDLAAVPADPAQASRYYRLKAFGHADLGQLVQAEQAARKELETSPESLDALFILAFVHLSMREYEQAVAFSNRYIEACNGSGEAPAPYAGSKAHLCQVYNFLGSAAYEQSDLAAAERHYEEAIGTDPANHLPYLNLANLHKRLDRPEQARQTVERGLKACSQVHELRLLKRSLQRRATVSACMIVRNEEELLPGCLDSIRDWADEIIIVDTGSTDRTVEIAEAYGARIFHQPWEGDFSKHRNYSIDQAGSDWIFIIDADERLVESDVPELQRHLNEAEIPIIAVNVVNVGGKFDEQVTFLPSIRCFRRELGLRYEGIVHNQLQVDPGRPVLRTGVTIKHLGYGLSPEKLQAKATRTIELLNRQLADNPDNAFALFNYAQVLLGLGLEAHPDNADKIIEASARAVELTRPEVRGERHIHLMALQQLALCHFLIGRYGEARSFAHRALEYKEDYLDPILLLGNIALRTGEHELAEDHFHRYLETQSRYDESSETEDMIVVHPRSIHHARYGLGLAAEKRGQWSEARRHYEAVLAIMPEFIDTNSRLGYIYLRDGRMTDAGRCFQQQLDADPGAHIAAVGLALVRWHEGGNEEADRFIKTALENTPADSPAMLQHAYTLEQVERKTEALWFLEKAVGAENLDHTTRRDIAAALFRLGRYEQAAELFERVVAGGEADGDLLNDLGGCYYKLGRYEEAEQKYMEAVDRSVPPAISYRNLGLARVQLGRPKEAAVVLEKYRELAPDQHEIVHLLADLHARLGDFNAAIRYYEEFLQVQPGDPLVLFALSECYLAMGHRDSAILGYRRVLELDHRFPPAQQRLAELAERAGTAGI